MVRMMRRLALLVAASSVLAQSNCGVTTAQYRDFGRTEVARVISDVIGQQLFVLLVGTSTNVQNFE